MLIRPEDVVDYVAIADLHAQAFGHRAGEALIVALHRQRSTFDPALSLVAEMDERVVGHVLFSPHWMRLLGQTVPVVNLAPLAIAPSWQRQGIGGRLIAEGHAVAAAKGYVLSFLLGHTDYYPRFGYRTHAYGAAQALVPIDASVGEPSERLERHVPTSGDVSALRALWSHDEADVDFALDPGPHLLDWISPNPAIQATVYARAGEVVGYTRVHTSALAEPRVFLAHDGATAHARAHLLAQEAAAPHLVLPVHPAAAAATGFVSPRCDAGDSAMACPLAPSPLDDSFAHVRAGQRSPGRPTWPVAFDLD